MLHQSAGGIVIGSDGKVVVVSQNGDSWSLPKGHLEPGETEEEAARREIYEETGLTDLVFVKKLGSYSRPTIGKGGIGENVKQMKRITLFLCRTNQTDLHPIDPENPEAIWLPLDEVAAKLHHQKDKDAFLRYLPDIKTLLPKD